MFFSLADYGGKRCVTKMSLLDMEGGVIGTEWTRVRIPFRPSVRNAMGSTWPTSRSCASSSSRRGRPCGRHPHRAPSTRIWPGGSTSTHRVTELPFTLGEGQESWWGINRLNPITSFCRPPTGWEARRRWWPMSGWRGRSLGQLWVRGPPVAPRRCGGAPFDIGGSVPSQAESPPKLRMTLFAYRGTGGGSRPLWIRTISRMWRRENGPCVCPSSPFVAMKTGLDCAEGGSLPGAGNARFTAGDFELAEFRGNPDKPFKWKGG